MNLVYIDDSGDDDTSIFSAISIPSNNWHEAFKNVKAFRRSIWESDKIYVTKELHAWKFVSGRGKISPTPISKSRRCHLYNVALKMITKIEGVQIFNVVFPKRLEHRGFERLLNRINRTAQAQGTTAMIISDEGKEGAFKALRRKMGIYNPIASNSGAWQSGNSTKNIPLNYIIEDIVFKDSKHSIFVQLADFCAYALLRKEVQLASKNKYGLHKSFDILDPVLMKKANGKDPQGIIRP